MAEIVNLRMARKARARAADKMQAAENRALHGQTKAERKATEADVTRITRTVEGAKRDRTED
ncbi:DUF4169 family protein [Novosphingobium sp. 2580]|uniref:DUF4169 family protein n=2 Tax=Novosphingobium album (ex Hu et al. 2023) TaxID=2930093 RepID=A0ABT0B2K9_9SPHN|nr:DUF4169 family protein [Novosphingobium album (ex Hu et al. 2023)]